MKMTEGLAIYGACLSSIVFIWNILNSRSRIKVDVMDGFKEIIDDHLHGIYIIIRNPSGKSVHLANVSLLHRDDVYTFWQKIEWVIRFKRFSSTIGWVNSSLSLYGVDDCCPLELPPGKSHDIFISHEQLNDFFDGKGNTVIRAVVQDQLWRDKVSRSFEYNA